MTLGVKMQKRLWGVSNQVCVYWAHIPNPDTLESAMETNFIFWWQFYTGMPKWKLSNWNFASEFILP